jgi:hypothetical protein
VSGSLWHRPGPLKPGAVLRAASFSTFVLARLLSVDDIIQQLRMGGLCEVGRNEIRFTFSMQHRLVPICAGHYIHNTGSGILRLLVGFNNGHDHSHDLSAWLASNPPDVLAANLGLPRRVADALAKERLFVAGPSNR